MPDNEPVAAPKLKQFLGPHCTRFRAGRKASGVTLTALVGALGISEQAILQFETGKQRLDLERFALACDLLGLNCHWVLLGSGEPVAHAPKLPSKGRPAKRTT